ncbi:MAG: 50S ribosomal protein L32 [Candidatus Omnitrophica bacterium]|nr:50S ribosomal protein L32 [Candidatus Omnitrophota bacterium]MDD5574403.1 50S ribosomal protein L32 [Candidatus Omnitrophota bacterium]
MPNPRRRHSKTRGRKRRTHWKVDAVQLMECSQCKSPKLSHRICPVCGYYNGKLVLDFEAKRVKKDAKKKKTER